LRKSIDLKCWFFSGLYRIVNVFGKKFFIVIVLILYSSIFIVMSNNTGITEKCSFSISTGKNIPPIIF